MATIGEILSACAAARIPTDQIENLDLVILNSDDDEVSFDVKGYDDENDQFLLRLSEVEVPTSSKPVSADVITVTVPEGVEVKVERAE